MAKRVEVSKPRRDGPEIASGAPKLDEPASALAMLKTSGRLELEPIDPEVSEHRRFPRAKLRVPFTLYIGEDTDRRFSAALRSNNLSVSGAFLESTFFLPVGTELQVRFSLEGNAEPVQARAEIVREERPDPRTGEGRSGFAIRFLEFSGQTEVTLAKLFLGEQLRAFAERYLQSRRARGLSNELDRVVDALAAWELLKVTSPENPWSPV